MDQNEPLTSLLLSNTVEPTNYSQNLSEIYRPSNENEGLLID